VEAAARTHADADRDAQLSGGEFSQRHVFFESKTITGGGSFNQILFQDALPMQPMPSIMPLLSIVSKIFEDSSGLTL
jgi:hypothetical protein